MRATGCPISYPDGLADDQRQSCDVDAPYQDAAPGGTSNPPRSFPFHFPPNFPGISVYPFSGRLEGHRKEAIGVELWRRALLLPGLRLHAPDTCTRLLNEADAVQEVSNEGIAAYTAGPSSTRLKPFGRPPGLLSSDAIAVNLNKDIRPSSK